MSDHLNFKIVDPKNESDFNTIDLQKLDIDLTINDKKLPVDLDESKINHQIIPLEEKKPNINENNNDKLDTLNESIFETLVLIIKLEKRH